MMLRIISVFLLLAVLSCASTPGQRVHEQGVREAVERMLVEHPHSTLQDIYKSFFQDRFGPGHIVSDTAQAAAFLRRELSAVTDVYVPLYEPTGACGNYVRVALAVVASGKVSFEKYLSCFLRSVRNVESVEVEEWAEEWQQIEKIISRMCPELPAYKEDSAAIAAMLVSGHYAVHHSKRYNEHYAPHYRIIAKEIFEEEILPLLK